MMKHAKSIALALTLCAVFASASAVFSISEEYKMDFGPKWVQRRTPVEADHIAMVEVFQDENVRKAFEKHVINPVTANGDFKNKVQDRQSCHDCMKTVVLTVVERLVNQLELFCSQVQEPHFKQMCESAREHPQLVIGYMIARAKPMMLAGAYCMGRNQCSKDEVVTQFAELPPEIINNLTEENAMYIAAHPKTHEELYKNVVKTHGNPEESVYGERVEKELQQNYNKYKEQCINTPTIDNTPLGPQAKENRCKCFACSACAARGAMKEAVQNMMAWCYKNAGTSKQADTMCRSSQILQEMTAGSLMAHVTPWPFGVGYCVAEKQCSLRDTPYGPQNVNPLPNIHPMGNSDVYQRTEYTIVE